MHSGHALVAQRKKISSGARGERPLKRCIYARTARRHDEEVVSEDKPACFEALASLYASAGDCTGRHDTYPYIMNCISHCLDIDRVIEVEIHSAQHSWHSTPGQLLKKAAQATPESLLRLFVLVHNAPDYSVRDESTFFARTVQIFPK